jgi:hypothetical protein
VVGPPQVFALHADVGLAIERERASGEGAVGDEARVDGSAVS